jgi:hypothetical protein
MGGSGSGSKSSKVKGKAPVETPPLGSDGLKAVCVNSIRDLGL